MLVQLSHPSDSRADALTRALHDVFDAYVDLVENFSLCPFSRPARARDQVGFYATSHCELDTSVLAPALLAPTLDVILLALPNMRADGFAAAVETLRRQHQDTDGGTVFALESFLPVPLPTASPDAWGQKVRIVRCTPVPTIQLTRLSTLERIKAGGGQTRFVDASRALGMSEAELLALNGRDVTRDVHDAVAHTMATRYADLREALAELAPRAQAALELFGDVQG